MEVYQTMLHSLGRIHRKVACLPEYIPMWNAYLKFIIEMKQFVNEKPTRLQSIYKGYITLQYQNRFSKIKVAVEGGA